MRGETRRKARSRYPGDEALRRVSPRRRRERRRRERERGRAPLAPRRTPEGAKRGHGSGRSGTDRSRARRVAQDSTPTAYMYTPSGATDAQIARPAQGVPLPEPWPHVDRQTSTAQGQKRLGLVHVLGEVLDADYMPPRSASSAQRSTAASSSDSAIGSLSPSNFARAGSAL